jgi:cytochrome oxidase assembly protein ShyY1|tara:strand:- start:2845 stop:3585 length:741 start_codon:yes stop_codon:yes gene_type:complete
MADIKHQGLQFTLDWRASLLVLMLLPLLLSLGFWQLERADEKRVLQELFQQRQSAGPIAIEELSENQDLRYQPLTLRGRYINEKSLYLDNRIYQGRFGYEIITPFRPVSSDDVVWVNRGWIAGDVSRRTLPKIDPIVGEVELLANVYVSQGEVLMLAEEEKIRWMGVVQAINFEKLSQKFDQRLFPHVVRLSSESPGSYQPNWVVVNLQPEKHVGYAVQWFAMSVTLLLIAFLANTNCWALIKGRK